MRFLTPFACTLIVALPTLVHPANVGADESQAAEKKESVSDKIQGRWDIVSGVNQGRKLTPTEVDGTHVVVNINSITTYDASEQQRFRAVFQIDESKNPVHITMTSVIEKAPTKLDVPATGRQNVRDNTSAGILKFDGKDQWTLCYALPGSKRPTKFESPKDSKTMLFVLKRKPVDENLVEKSSDEE